MTYILHHTMVIYPSTNMPSKYHRSSRHRVNILLTSVPSKLPDTSIFASTEPWPNFVEEVKFKIILQLQSLFHGRSYTHSNPYSNSLNGNMILRTWPLIVFISINVIRQQHWVIHIPLLQIKRWIYPTKTILHKSIPWNIPSVNMNFSWRWSQPFLN